jgi:tetratricopeptide (TPR) repeat protein
MANTLLNDAKGPEDFVLVESEFKQAADLAPQWPDARYKLALVKEAEGKYSGAIDDLKLCQQLKLSDDNARKVQDKIYVLEAKAHVAAKKQEEQDQVAATAERKKRETQQVLYALKSIVGNSEYWWYMASVGNYMKGGRTGLTMSELESGKDGLWWSWGTYRSKYVFKGDKVYICKYAYQRLDPSAKGGVNGEVVTDLNPDTADLIGTPNGPNIDDIIWEYVAYYDQSGAPQNKKQVWAHINQSNGDITFSGNRPPTNPDRDAVYSYWWYSRK